MPFLDARSFLIEVLDHSVDGILAVDAQGQIVVWSRALERMFGKGKVSVLGQSVYDVLPFLRETGEDWRIREALAGRAGETPEQRFFIPESGREGWFEARYAPLRGGEGDVTGALGIFRDRTAMRAERERAAREAAAPALPGTAAGGLPASTVPGSPGGSPPPGSPRRSFGVPARPAPPRLEAAREYPVFDREAALREVGDAYVLEEFAQGFIVSLPEFIRDMDEAVSGGDPQALAGNTEDLRKAVTALGGLRTSYIAGILAETLATGDADAIQRVWWRLRRELAVLRETLRGLHKAA